MFEEYSYQLFKKKKVDIIFEQTLHQKEIKMSNKQMKKWSTSLTMRKLPIKTTARNNYIPMKMNRHIYKQTIAKAEEDARQLELSYFFWWEYKVAQPQLASLL